MSSVLPAHAVAPLTRWLQQWPVEGPPAFRIGRAGDTLVAEWPGFAILRASRSGDWHVFEPAPGADPSLVAKFYSGLVRALLGHLRGELTLHASAVLLDDGQAVVFFGDSGCGKSTTAADLCASSGASLLADDTATIDLHHGVAVVPNDELSWLTPDALAVVGARGAAEAAVHKSPWTPRHRAVRPARLAALVQLAFDSEETATSISRVVGHDAFTALSLATVRFALDDPDRALADFDKLASLAERVPMYVLRRPPQWTQLEAARKAIAQLVQRLREARGDHPPSGGGRA